MALFDLILVGRGSFLYRSAMHAVGRGLRVAAFVAGAPQAASPLDRLPVAVLGSGNPNDAQSAWSSVPRITPIVCTNNPYILEDHFLEVFHNTFNIHSSDVRDNRGLAQLCMLHSMLSGSTRGGATVQKLQIGAEVDASPTLCIRPVRWTNDSSFSSIFGLASGAWLQAFGEVLAHLERGDECQSTPLDYGPEISVELLRSLVSDEGAYSLALHRWGLGQYSRFFPKTSTLVADFQKFWSATF